MVDSTDGDRLDEAYDELAILMSEKQLRDALWFDLMHSISPLSLYLSIPALIFVVDSTDGDRLDEAYDELAILMSEKQLRDALWFDLMHYFNLPSLSLYLSIPALIFVVDSTDGDRLDEAYDELAILMSEKQLRDALLLIFANKQVSVDIKYWLL